MPESWRDWPLSQKRALLTRLQTLNAEKDWRTFGQRYYGDVAGFMRDCIVWPDGRPWAPYQLEIARELFEHGKEAVRSNRGTGKSATAAGIVEGFALTREALGIGWRVVTTASIWRQLALFLWPEVHKIIRQTRWGSDGGVPRPMLADGSELMNMSIQLKYGRADAIASKEGATIEGGHDEEMLVIFDEAKIIPASIWDSARGMFTSGKAYWLALSTPEQEQGRFFDIFRRARGWDDWHLRHVTLEEALEAGRVSRDWVDEMAAAYDENDPFFRQQVLGEFANYSDTGGIVPLTWIEQANQRWDDWDASGRPGTVTSIGFDVGGGLATGDASVIAVIVDWQTVAELIEIRQAADPHTATMELAGHVAAIANKYGRPVICGDAQGIGNGVVARLIEMGFEAIPFVASYGTTMTDATGIYGFGNWRAAMWWLMREALTPDSGQDIALPAHEGLTGDLTAPRIKRIDSRSRRFVEDKEDVRARLGRSPDCADAVLHGLIGPILARERAAGEQVSYRITDYAQQIGRY